MSIRRILLVAAAAGAAALPAPLLAQQKITVSGTVKDVTGQPIEQAEVMVTGTDLHAKTSESGAFRIDSVPIGRRWVVVRRLGFEPVAHALTFEKGKNRDLQVEMDPLPQTLPTKTIEARSGFSGRYAEFYRRQRSGWGHFITRDDIEREHPARLSWLVQRYLPFTDPQLFDFPLASPAMSARPSRRSLAFGGPSAYERNCPPAISVDGARPFEGWALNDFNPDDVEAIEVYRGRYSEIPIEYASDASTRCGLIVVWTR